MVAMKLPPSLSETVLTLYLFTPVTPLSLYPCPLTPGFPGGGRAIVLPVSE